MTGGTARPRLILLTQWFDPEPTMKGLAFAQGLQDLGFDVEVVTGFPNYPGGKVYEGYRIRPIQREVQDGIEITRLPLYPSHDNSRLGRIVNYGSFFIAATLYLTIFARRADALYVYHPPLSTGMAGALVRLVRRIPMVLDVQDMWPDTLRATGMVANTRILNFIGILCRWTWRRADKIAVLSDGFKRLLVERGVQLDKIAVIHNWADETTQLHGPRPEEFLEAGKFRVLFAGNMGPAQALDSVLDAAAIVMAHRPDVEFCFLGSGIVTEGLIQRARSERLSNVRFLPRVSAAEVGAWLTSADCLLVHLKADPLFSITIPSKTQAYMAAGKPIIMAVDGDAADMIRKSSAGAVVPSEDPSALASAVMSLAALPSDQLETLGASARQFYQQELSFKQGVEKFAALFRAVMKNKASRSD